MSIQGSVTEHVHRLTHLSSFSSELRLTCLPPGMEASTLMLLFFPEILAQIHCWKCQHSCPLHIWDPSADSGGSPVWNPGMEASNLSS